jgi:hypothetical protein
MKKITIEQAKTLGMSEETIKKAQEQGLVEVPRVKTISRVQVSPRTGVVSVYGLGRMPINLYRDQWEILLNNQELIRNYITNNRAEIDRLASSAPRL